MSIKNLAKTWSLPDRTQDRQQLTLRIPYDLYAKLHALKEVYNQRPVNDMITDILRAGLDEIIEALPCRELSAHEAEVEGFLDEYGKPVEGLIVGQRATFDIAYRRLLEAKSDEESQGEAA